ncbi:uncharacterized protein K452DRAFT_284296 [Aplosporella prunicola CBS 121167]|uniref:Secreted protein n=1 Tax=Aplosporella prunicola CBS 121167 TaxID=1176127 RepID=A0A6A6BNS3_9PEZI|nr:uncharacterized protein K452DRAFT_284296 [Aplosporella prunicola CBS 121167]KAF2144915.1 hypothetical protein K452DRAFT_284296 [Aplosporella prunicola CBS 121167]
MSVLCVATLAYLCRHVQQVGLAYNENNAFRIPVETLLRHSNGPNSSLKLFDYRFSSHTHISSFSVSPWTYLLTSLFPAILPFNHHPESQQPKRALHLRTRHVESKAQWSSKYLVQA